MARSKHTLPSPTRSDDLTPTRLHGPCALSTAIVLALAMAGPAMAAENEAVDFSADTPAGENREPITLPFSDAVERTLSQNAARDLSQARIAEAQAAIEQAQGNLLPTLDLSFSVMGSNNPLNVFGMKLQQEQATYNDFGVSQYLAESGFQDFFQTGTTPDESRILSANSSEPDSLNDPGWHHNIQTSLKLSIPVYNGGKIREMRTQAQALLRAARSGDEAARQQLILHTVEAYAGINTALAFVDVAKKGREAAHSFRDLSRSLHKEGVVTRADLLKAEVNLGDRELDVDAARNQVGNAVDGLKILAGLDRTAAVEIAEVIDVSLPDTTLETARQRALTNNPRIQALGGEIAAARSEVDVARADFKPHFNLMAQQDLNSERLNEHKDSYTVGGKLTWRALDFGGRSGRVDRAQARVNAGLAERQQALDELMGQVGEIWREARLAERRVQTREKAIEHSKEAVRLERLRYEEGVATMTELLAAQAELDKARAERIRARFQRTMQRASLWLALGELDPSLVDSHPREQASDDSRDGTGADTTRNG